MKTKTLVSRVLILTVICFAFVGLGWYQPNVADAETLTVSNPYSIPTGTKYDTAAYVLMQRFDLTSGGTPTDGKVVLNSLTLDDGAGTATSYNAARVYIASTSSTTLPASAVQVGRTLLGSAWSGVSTPIALSSAATVTTGTPMYLYIMFDMAPGQAPLTARSNVTAIGTVADGAAAGAFPFLSAGTITLSAGGLKATVTTCQDCHGTSLLDSPTRSAATGSFMGSHNKHVDSMSYACSACHINPAATNHRNGLINMANPFLNGGAGNYSKSGPTFTFAQSSNPLPFGTCNTIYCHSNGISTYSPPTWGGSAMPATCTGCHGGNSTSGAIVGGAHANHINSAGSVGRLLNCRDCHNATVTSSTDRAIATPANHVNGSLNVKFYNAGGIVLDSDAPTYNSQSTTTTNGAAVTPGTYGVCNNVYCHSTGNLNGAALVSVAGVSTFKQPDWNATPIGCTGCHGDGAGKSHPTYMTGSAGSTTANSHVKHVESSNLACNYCHAGTVGTTTITATPASMPSNTWHLNRSEDVTFWSPASMQSKSGIYNANKSCSVTYCHGTGPSVQWGDVTTCASGHEASVNLASGTTDTRNRHWQHVELAAAATNFLATNNTVTASYEFGCGVCHSGQPHAQGMQNAGAGIAAQVAFSVPWSAGSTTGSYSAGTNTFVDGKGFGYSWNGTCSAVYCHSNGAPLGSGGVFTGVSVSWGKTLATAPNDCSVCHGGRADSATPIATNRHTQHINSTWYNFNCNECHAGTTTTGTTITNKQNHVDGNKDVVWLPGGRNSDGTAYATPNCANIYCHSRGTSAAAPYASRITPSWNGSTLDCAGCHGNTAATLTTGAHAKHLGTSTWLAGLISCNACHNATTTTNSTITNYGNHVNRFVTIQLGAASSGATATYAGSLVGGASFTNKSVNSTKGTCNTTYCHGGNSAAWDAVIPANTSTCVKCHGVTAATTTNYSANPLLAAPGYISASNPTGTGVSTAGNTGTYVNGVSNDSKVGAHDSHLRGSSNFKPGGIGCDDCHAVTALTSSGHMNGTTTFVWSNTAQNIGTTPYFADKGAIVPGYAGGTCSTNYCHGGGFSAAVMGTGTTVTWTNQAYLVTDASVTRNAADCNKCHMSPPTASSKYAHAGLTIADNCAGCHGPKGEGGKGPNLAMSRMARSPAEEELIKVITDGIDGTQMPTSRLDQGQIKEVAAFVQHLGVLNPEVVPGNAKKGEQLYFSKGNCTQCHAIKGRGGASGPDLTEIGLRRGAAYLRLALTNPEADVPKGFSSFGPDTSIPQNFLVVRVVTKNGQGLTGVRVNEDTFSIQLRDSSDQVHSFFKSDLTELHKDWGKSPMPSYREVFSNGELDDVVAYLVSLGRQP
jgi:predicted CxxxxCH...CXXCH cytochrome family protein